VKKPIYTLGVNEIARLRAAFDVPMFRLSGS
jgi:hypothetical protein